jgi:hypothetical protein
MSAQHTSGPWKAHIWRHPGQPDTVCVKDANGREIIAWTGFDGTPCTKAETRANARLAAAAPDLLNLLRAAQATLRARYIGKGTVGGSCSMCGTTWHGTREQHDSSCLIERNEAAISSATRGS